MNPKEIVIFISIERGKMPKSKKLYLFLGMSFLLPLGAAQYDHADMQDKVKRLFNIGSENSPKHAPPPFQIPQSPSQDLPEKPVDNKEFSTEDKTADEESDDFPLDIQEITPQENPVPMKEKAAETQPADDQIIESQDKTLPAAEDVEFPQEALDHSQVKENQNLPTEELPTDIKPPPSHDTQQLEGPKETPLDSSETDIKSSPSTPPSKEEKESSKTQQPEDDNKTEELRLKPASTWTEQEASLYRMPSTAVKGIKGINAPYELWIDPYEWEETDDLNVHADRSFKSASGNAYAIIVAQKKKISLNDLEDIIIKNAAESGFEKVSVVQAEKRLVNGQEVLFLHWQAHINRTPIEFLSYLYTNNDWVILLHTYTPEESFNKNQQSMEHFLDGISPN